MDKDKEAKGLGRQPNVGNITQLKPTRIMQQEKEKD